MASKLSTKIIGKPLFILAGIGVVLGFVAAYYYRSEKPAETPVFNPASNPYAQGNLRPRNHRKLSDQRREHQYLSGGRRNGNEDPRDRRPGREGGNSASATGRLDSESHDGAAEVPVRSCADDARRAQSRAEKRDSGRFNRPGRCGARQPQECSRPIQKSDELLPDQSEIRQQE